jgi:hypothetical protein
MIGRFRVVSRPTSTSKKSAALGQLVASGTGIDPDADAAGTAHDLSDDEERRQVPHDVRERGGP